MPGGDPRHFVSAWTVCFLQVEQNFFNRMGPD